MKKAILLGVIFLTQVSMSFNAQQTKDPNLEKSFNNSDTVVLHSQVLPMTFRGTTINLRDAHPVDMNAPVPFKAKGERDWPKNEYSHVNSQPQGLDPALQKDYAPRSSNRAPTYNWEGIGYTSVNPADPTLDVGPNHVVQMINGSTGTKVQVFDKTGTAITGVVNMSTLCGTTAGDGDPIVMYDERADRWVLTEFLSSGNNLLIAVSTSPDPTGTYYTYTIASPGGFPDYPKYSIWEDSYVCTANVGSSDIFVFDRNSMLTGGAASTQYFTQSNFGTITFQAATPVSLNGTTAPPTGAPAMIMRMRDDAWTGAASDALEIWDIDIDWVTPANSTMTQNTVLGIAAYDSDLCGYTTFNCIPQPATTQTIDPLREVLMNRIHYRNFGSHESIVCCHVADVDGTDHAGIRWYELRRSGGTTGAWTIYQEGTYAPDSDNRFMASIGISATGNIGLMFNISSSTTYPSIHYTGRKECDPLNTMTEPETVIINGSGSQGSSTGGRYGDYNSMGLDPVDGETFYCTAMYNPSGQWSTRNAAFKLGQCGANVQFGNSAYTVSEPDANVSNGCLDYYILQVPISITADPSQPADVTVNVSGGTATQGVDYDISSTSFTFDGTSLTGNVEIWVYNDNYVEGTETITLDYTLNANGGDAAAGTLNQTVTVTINDDDLAPASMVNTSTILSQDFETGMAPFTTVNNSGNTPWQIGNVTNTPNGAYAIPGDNATEFAWIDDDDCNCDQSDTYLESPVIDLTNYTSVQMTFDSYYEANTYNGDTEDAEVRVSTDGGTTYTTVQNVNASIIDGSWVANSADLSAFVGNANVKVAIWYSDGTGWLYGCAVDNIILTGTSPIDIQQAVNTTSGMTANLGPNSTVHFYDPASNDVMLSITNTSAWDYGCVTVEVDRDGTSPTALQFNTTNTPDYLTGKTYTVVPTNTNPSGTYDITLYYKEAEVAAWETITGNSRNNAEIIKVAGNNRINDVTPANYTSYTIDNIGATLGSFNSDVTFTSSFTNGFSGFGVGIYNLPTTIVTHTTVNTNPSCNTGTDGSIVVTASGGSSPYQYSIDNGTTWQMSNTFNGLSAGSYSVIVQDGGGNSSTVSTEVLTTPIAITYTEASSDPTCNGGTDGSITLSGSGGTGSLQYSIDNGTTFQASGSFTGLTAGTYNIVVEDANGCQTTGSIVLTDPASITYTVSSTGENCNAADGSLTLSATGGTGSLQYSIDNGTTFQASGTFNGLTAGSYNVVIEDANGCQTSGSETVNSIGGVSITSVNSTDLTCNGDASGTISIVSSGGTGTITYSIDGGTTTQTSGSFTGLAAGNYNILVEDANGCQAISSATLNEPIIISYTSVNTAENCGSADGSIVITATGGTGSLQYSIDGGSTFQASNSFSGLTSGTYNVVIEDANGCQTTGTEPINGNGGATITSANTTDLSCNASNDGAITIVATGGTGSLQYSTDGGTSFQASGSFTGLAAGTYNIVVEDANGCQTTSSATINEPNAITYTSTITDENCGASDGAITLVASGGSGSFQYSIDGGTTFQTSGTFTNLSGGVYNIVITDGNSCSTSGTESINSTGGATINNANGTDPTCYGSNDGSITIVATGGTAPLQYSIDGGTTFQTASFINGLGGGMYTIVVEDANGCQSISSVTLNEPSQISTTINTVFATCGNADGSATVATTGGNGSYTYQWDDSANQTTASATNLTAGFYHVTVTDGNGCSSSDSVYISNIGDPTVITSATDVSCYGMNDGTATAQVIGGVLPYSLVWDDASSQTSDTATSLTAGTYTVQVTDNAGCIAFGSVTVNQPDSLSLMITGINTSCAMDNGLATATVVGGTSPFNYSWNDSQNQSTTTAINLTAGSYTVVINDANGCTVSDNVTLLDSDSLVVTVDVIHESCVGKSDGSITTTVAGGQSPFSYLWSTGDSTSSITNLTAGEYTVSVSDAHNCSTILLIPIETEGGNCIVIPTAISPNNDAANDVWFIDGLEEYPEAKVEIYNRWGGLIFSTTEYNNDWDGTYNGQNVPAGVYYYIVQLSEDETYTGSLTIIR